VRVANKIKRSE